MPEVGYGGDLVNALNEAGAETVEEVGNLVGEYARSHQRAVIIRSGSTWMTVRPDEETVDPPVVIDLTGAKVRYLIREDVTPQLDGGDADRGDMTMQEPEGTTIPVYDEATWQRVVELKERASRQAEESRRREQRRHKGWRRLLGV